MSNVKKDHGDLVWMSRNPSEEPAKDDTQAVWSILKTAHVKLFLLIKTCSTLPRNQVRHVTGHLWRFFGTEVIIDKINTLAAPGHLFGGQHWKEPPV